MNISLRKAGFFIFLGILVLWVPLPVAANLPQDRLIHLEASRFAYNPGVISVHQGDQVTLELHSKDVVHGLFIDGYELEIRAEPGQSSRITFVANRSGSFRMRCSVTCGPLHAFMLGKFRVKPDRFALRAISLSFILAFAAIHFPIKPSSKKVIRRKEGNDAF